MITWEKLKRALADPFSFRLLAADINNRLDALQTEVEQVKNYSATAPQSIESFALDIRDQQHKLQTELEKVKELSSSLPGVLESFAADAKEQQLEMQRVLDRAKDHLPENKLSLEAFAADVNKHQERLQNDVEFIKNHMSSYLGEGTGLTHLIDETPIYINTNDFGCPANFINGGRYEEEYFAVLASFRKPDSVFLDIGSNLGVFSLRMAPLLRHGKIHAFEPNNAIRQLFARSIHLNGIKHQINLYGVGVSDSDQRLSLSVPEGHAGGGSLTFVDGEAAGMDIEVRRLDGLLPDVRFDLAKIDVEGHELQALRGMTNMLRRSGNAVLLFEKLNANSGIEPDLMGLFSSLWMSVYRIDGVTLTPVDLPQFSASEAYFLAARPAVIGDELTRNFITIYPNDLYAIDPSAQGDCLLVDATHERGTLLFHGPYWYLPRGSYNITIDGDIAGEFSLTLAEKYGYQVEEFVVSAQTRSFNFVVQRDLTHFEVVGRALSGHLSFRLNSIRFTRTC
jgi:FkbM family methyltransferase